MDECYLRSIGFHKNAYFTGIIWAKSIHIIPGDGPRNGAKLLLAQPSSRFATKFAGVAVRQPAPSSTL